MTDIRPVISPVVAPVDATLAGLTLFAGTARYHGDDDDGLHQIWAADEAQARLKLIDEVLEASGYDVEQMSITEHEAQREYVYVIDVQPVLTISSDGQTLTLA